MKSTFLIFVFSSIVYLGFPGTADRAYSQSGDAISYEVLSPEIQYESLTLKKVNVYSTVTNKPSSEIPEAQELSVVEAKIAEDLGSNWAWPENTLEAIDSYGPFLFRTKKSRQNENVKLVLHVNEVGRISGFDMISDVDKGLENRLDHMIRQLPDCKAVPGFSQYSSESFELTISREQIP
ncbi:hypothetical protein [Algoriphagus sediminis]|uniref:TonB C-terminal domain-containing protein n=1 Tax=Algoriphagus sediminis TaxID=3057113 RepID=A0ABT7YE27_9BACT|nr:hypothetical protein [Algoriphagus sediminis]MDN3204774.1 hypothetical protein [Algoriphagus sediminis]